MDHALPTSPPDDLTMIDDLFKLLFHTPDAHSTSTEKKQTMQEQQQQTTLTFTKIMPPLIPSGDNKDTVVTPSKETPEDITPHAAIQTLQPSQQHNQFHQQCPWATFASPFILPPSYPQYIRATMIHPHPQALLAQSQMPQPQDQIICQRTWTPLARIQNNLWHQHHPLHLQIPSST